MVVRETSLTVRCPTENGETLAVSGSSDSLGCWRKSGLVHMVKGEGDLWHASLSVDLDVDDVEVSYRYAIVVVLPPAFPSAGRKVVVRRWESHLHPRRLSWTDAPQEDVFGQVDGETRVQRGWLTEEMVVQIKIHNGGLDLWRRKEAGGRVFAKLTALSRRESEGEESLDLTDHLRESNSGSWPVVEAAALTEGECERRVQGQYGVEYKKEEGTFLLFEVQMLQLATVAFLVDIFTKPDEAQDCEAAKHVGMGFIYPENFKQTAGRLQSPITSLKFQPIGSLSYDFLVVKPLPDIDMDFSVTYRKYWSAGWSGLDVGHRGLGNSYTQGGHCSHVKENTLASMRDAVLHGADMVEFDVQVSRDLVPCIYHEFEICVVTKTKENKEVMLEVPVKDLRLEELQGLRSHHPTERERGVKSFETDGLPEHQSFPTLSQVLDHLDPSCGANIEVKYGQTMKDGKEETASQLEMNLFVDQILKTVMRESRDRKIVFSSFSPDICTMLSCKQNRFPVLLLTQGRNSKYEDYRDPRTWTITNGIWFAKMAGLLGLSAMAEALLRDPNQLSLVRESGQIIFAWTDDQNDLATVQHLKRLGVDGVIYDRMDQNNEKSIKESVFLKEKRKYASSLGSTSNASSSPKSSPETSPQHSSPSFSGVVFPS